MSATVTYAFMAPMARSLLLSMIVWMSRERIVGCSLEHWTCLSVAGDMSMHEKVFQNSDSAQWTSSANGMGVKGAAQLF